MRSNDDLKDEHFRIGTQYYVTARFAAIKHIDTVSGLLFHYAIEMLLKGHLCLAPTDKERKWMSHRVEEHVWPAFKNMVHDPNLDRYDRVIHAIDVFWELRYPDDLLRTGMTLRIGMEPPPPGPIITPKPMPHFDLIVDDMDRLVAVIFEKSSRCPKYFNLILSGEALNYLTKWNKTGVW